MTDVYVIRNQLGHYWAKSKAWVDGSEPRTVMRARHEDEAINTLFELSSKDFELRGEVVAAQLSERGDPVIEASQIPLAIDTEQDEEPPVMPESVDKAESEAQADSETILPGGTGRE